MSRRDRAAGAAFVALVPFIVLTGACRAGSPSDRDVAPTPVTAAPIPGSVPVDHLANGELLEGTEQAFGMNLPRGVHVDEAFADTVYASGMVPLHALAQYLEARLQGGDLREGEAAATFERTQLPGRPGRDLLVRMSKAGQTVHLEIHDTTPPPLPNLPDEKARWRAVGLTPDGHLADPTHLD